MSFAISLGSETRGQEGVSDSDAFTHRLGVNKAQVLSVSPQMCQNSFLGPYDVIFNCANKHTVDGKVTTEFLKVLFIHSYFVPNPYAVFHYVGIHAYILLYNLLLMVFLCVLFKA